VDEMVYCNRGGARKQSGVNDEHRGRVTAILSDLRERVTETGSTSASSWP
jgi:hypothetical protein